MTCPVCGTVAVPGARFCHHCGAALPAAATLPAAERRVVTVLFGDLSDFTSWSEDLDPERVGAVTDRVLAALAAAVRTFGGHVDKLTGDGIMAVFGAPVAHEDDAERAVRAALAMQRAVRRVLDERGGGAPLGLRVGINTGEVVAGVQAAIEYTVIGDTVNTAARLADAAAVGTVWAGAQTVAATRHVTSWRRLRPLRLKGKREPVEAYELLGLLDAPGTRSSIGDEAPFVGREAELGRFAGRLAEVIDRSEPQVLVMTAEAGIGKTRFAAEAARLAANYVNSDVNSGRLSTRTGARVLSVRCAAFGERRRMAPLADLVRAAAGLPNDSSAQLTRAAVEDRLRRLGERLTHQRPDAPPIAVDLLLPLLGYGELPVSTGVPTDGSEWGANRAAADTEAVATAVAGLLSVLAAEAPLVVIVDDLHDALPETVDALGTMLSNLTGPVLVLLLGRPELVRTAGALTRVPDAEVHSLPPLRGADSARLLKSYLGGGSLPTADTDRLLATAQGNPFYLAELVTLLRERGALTPAAGANADGMWRLAPGSLSSQLLSRDLAAVLAARIDALPPAARSVLRDAAVVGDQVPAGALAALRERRGGRDGRPGAVATLEFEHAVNELRQRRMLHRDDSGYAFTTPLLRQAAYGGIGKADLAERHAILARWAAAQADSDRSVPGGLPPPARDTFIAQHVEQATRLADEVGLPADSPARAVASLGVDALGRAARRALAAGEPALAVEHLERAASLAGGTLSGPQQLVYARALLQAGRVHDALAYAEKIEADAGDDIACRVGALLVAGRAHRALGEYKRAAEVWQEALQTATEAGLTYERSEAMRRLGMTDFLNGRLAQASSRFAAAYQVDLRAGNRHGQAWSLQNLAWVTATQGDFAGADAVLGRAARFFAELRDPVGRAWLRGTTAFARMLAGRLTEARRLARLFLPFGERVGAGWAVGTLRAVAAYAAAELGDLAEADQEARRAYRDFSAVSDDWGRGLALVVRGVVARGLGEPEHAIDLFTEALEHGQRIAHPLLTGMAGTMRGFAALETGDVAAAEQDAQAVLTAVEPHNPLAPAQVAPRVLLATARLAAGDSDTALGLLAPLAAGSKGPALLMPRRQTLARYAAALLADGQREQALDWAGRAVAEPAEDVRSQVIAAQVLAEAAAANGEYARAREAAEEAVRLAYATAQLSERKSAEALRDRLIRAGADCVDFAGLADSLNEAQSLG